LTKDISFPTFLAHRSIFSARWS